MGKPDKVVSQATREAARKAFARLIAYLDQQEKVNASLVRQQEKDRMNAAIAFDLLHRTRFLGLSVEDRMATFKVLGYLYE